jgi:hypothetical protein
LGDFVGDDDRQESRADLSGRSRRDVDGDVHLVAGGEKTLHPVLGRVADNRHDDDADEERGQPDVSDASVMEWARNSDIQPTAAPATASMSTLLRTDHASPPWSGSSWDGLNRCAWVFRENTNPAAQEASGTKAT